MLKMNWVTVLEDLVLPALVAQTTRKSMVLEGLVLPAPCSLCCP